MDRVRIPRSTPSRNEATYARLVHRVKPDCALWKAFEGPLMRTGAMVNVSDLWPAPDFPATPLLIEYAGSDRTGWGHRRSNSIHILWRFDAGNKEWVEVARATGKGTEWLSALVPATLAQLGPRDLLKPADFAERASSRVLILLDRELELLALADRGAMLSVLYEKVTARFAECL